MLPKFSESEVSVLKRKAKRLKKQTADMTHTQALDQVARWHGFSNWSLLAKHVHSQQLET